MHDRRADGDERRLVMFNQCNFVAAAVRCDIRRSHQHRASCSKTVEGFDAFQTAMRNRGAHRNAVPRARRIRVIDIPCATSNFCDAVDARC